MSEDTDKKFQVNTDCARMKFEYRTCLIKKINTLLETISWPVHPKILDPNSECDLSEVQNIYNILLDRKEHIRKEKEFYKLAFLFRNTIDKQIRIPDDAELNKYCYGTKEFYDNYHRSEKK